MLTHPVGYASYAVPVRQYRYLQSGLLECMDHSKPPCHLLMLQVTNPTHKRLSLSGFLISKNYIYHSGHTHAVWRYGGWIAMEKTNLNSVFFRLLFQCNSHRASGY